MKFLHIVDVEYLGGYKVWLKFSDGAEGAEKCAMLKAQCTGLRQGEMGCAWRGGTAETAVVLDEKRRWGLCGEVDLSKELQGPIFEPLRDPEYFKGFSLEGHTLTWPNGADFAPEFLRSLISDTAMVK